MKKSLSIILALALVFSMFATVASAAVPTDTQGRYDALAAVGIFDGDGTGANLNGDMTREQLAKIVTKVANLKVEADGQVAATGFSDVATDRWSAGYINAVKKAGFMEGVSETSFDPTGKVTIEQLATVHSRVLGLTINASDTVVGNVSGWAKGYVAAAIKAGLISAQSDYTAAAKRSALVDATFTAIATTTPNPAIASDASSLAIGGTAKVTVSGVTAKDKVAYSVDKNGTVDSKGNFLATASGPSVVTASINGTKEVSVTINVYGAAAAIQLAATSSVPANSTTTGSITATVVDANGNQVANYSGSINLVVASGNNYVSLTAPTATVSNGVGTVSFTPTAVAGTSLISASAAGLTGSTLSVTTVAPKLTSVALSADISTIAADGSSSAITVAYKDQAGATLLAAYYPTNLAVSFNVSNTSIGNISSSNNNGATFTSTTNIGSTNISATLGATPGATIPADVAGITVAPITINTAIIGAPYKLAIDPIADAYAAGTSTTQTVKVRVLDANGNQVTGLNEATSTIQLTESSFANNPQITSVTIGNSTFQTYKGVATFTVTNGTAEPVTYTATLTRADGTKATATATGKFLAGPVNTISLVATQPVIAANGSATSTLKATLKDASGNANTAGSFSVKFSKTTNSNATAAFTDTTVASVNGEASVTVVSTTNVGTDKYRATLTLADGTTITTKEESIETKILGTANRLSTPTPVLGVNSAVAGTDVTVTVNVLDAGSNTVTYESGRTVSLAILEGTTTVNTLTATTVNGVATFKVNLTKASTYTVKPTSAGLTDSIATAQLTISPADAKSLKLTADSATIAADGQTEIYVTATGLDAYGNTKSFTTPGNVTIAASGLTFGQTTPYTSAGNGVVYKFKASTVPGVTTFTATNTTDALTSATTTVTTVLTGAASQLTVDPITAVTVTTQQTVTQQTVKVYVKDANGNLVTSYNGPVSLSSNGTLFTITPPINGNVINGIATGNAKNGIATFSATSAKSQTVTYTASTATPSTPVALTTTATGVVNPGVAAKIKTSVPQASIIADGSSITTITVEALDANDNVVTAENGTATITIPTGNDYVSLLATTAKLTNGVGTVQVRAKTLTGTANVSASYTVAGGTAPLTPVAQANVTTVAGAPSASLTTVSGVLNSGSTNVIVTVKDAFGNNVTGLGFNDFSATVAGVPQFITSVSPVGNAYIFTLFGNQNDVVVVKVKGVTITATTTIQ